MAAAGLLAAVAFAAFVQAKPPAVPPAPPAAAAPFQPSQLLVPPFPFDARLGAALARAARGGIDEAAGDLAELAQALPPADGSRVTKERIERDRTRLVALAAARRELLERCVKEQRKLHFKRGEQNLSGTLVEAAGGKLVLADAKGRRQELPLAALDPEELLKKMAEQKLETGSAATRAFAALLAGRKGWAKGLEAAADPEVAALKSDAPDCAALLATGRAVLALEELGRAPPLAAGAAVDATLAAIRTLLADHGKEAVVAARRDALRALARTALAIRFDAGGIGGAGLKGDILANDDGTVRLHYEFTNAALLADFTASDARHPSWAGFEIKLPKAKWSRKVDEEALALVGEGCLRHRVEFATPVSLDYEVQYTSPAEGLSAFSTLRAALCDDGSGTMVTNLDLTSIDSYRKGRRLLESADPGSASQEVQTRVTHAVRLSDDGKEALLRVAERPEQRIAAPDFASGGVALYWKSDSPIRLHALTIEGRVAPDGLAALREAAVARDLAALFGE
jgi:hypothetical protein